MNVITDKFVEDQSYSEELASSKRRRPYYQRNKLTIFSLFVSSICLVMIIIVFTKLQTLDGERTFSPANELLQSNGTLSDHDCRANQEMMQSLQEMNTTLNNILKHGDKVELCSVGIKTGLIKDADLSASSFHSAPYRAQYGRLDRPGSQFGCWIPHICGKAGDWLQVYLRTPTRVTGVVTQGRSDSVEDWVTGYKVAYGNSTHELKNVQIGGSDVIFDGNTDMHTHKTNMLPQPITARYFRIIVQTWSRCISLRMELLTC